MDSLSFIVSCNSYQYNHIPIDIVQVQSEYSNSFVHTYSLYDAEDSDISPLSLLNEITQDFRSVPAVYRNTGLLPPGVRFISNNFVVYERPPCVKTLFYIPQQVSHIDGRVEPIVYNIPIPWQLYVATFSNEYYCSDVYMYFMNTPLSSLDHNVYMPTLPNFYTNGLLCRPMFSSFEDVDRYSKNISGVVASSYDWVWNNGTNNDLTEPLVHLLLQNQNGQICQEAKKTHPMNFSNARLNSLSYLAPNEVTLILSIWEKMTIDDVLQYQFPNPSENSNFDSNTVEFRDYSAYYDNLYDYIYNLCDVSGEFGDYDGDPDDLVNGIIEDGSFDENIYASWLIQNNLIPTPSPSWQQKLTYNDLIERVAKSVGSLRRNNPSVLSDIQYVSSTLSIQ